MQNATRLAFNALKTRVAQNNQVDEADVKFNVLPTVQQKLENKLQLSSAFLSKINIVPVTEMSGEKLKLGTTSTIASRTNTTTTDRSPAEVTDLYSSTYLCVQTNFDTYIKYGTLDMWAKFPDFQVRVRNVSIKQEALDRLMIGWNGTSAAPTTDRAANPLLQDVNIGWLQHIRVDAPSHHMAEVVEDSTAVNVGEGWDYENIDALVMDVTENLIDEAARDNTALVVICGRGILADKYFSKVNRKQGAADELASDIIVSQKQIGGLEAIRVPFFPANALLVTTLDNLSLYFQEGKRRQQLVDNPKRDRIENYESSNDAYVVEDYGITALVENIVIKTEPKP